MKRKRTAKQIEMKGLSGWGGNRANAGRKNLSKTVNHMKRERFELKTPLQITLKLKPGLPNLRTKKMLEAFQKALVLAKARELRVIHYSLESNHAHLVVECMDNVSLGRAMKSFGSSFGKSVRRIAGGTGSVFVGRYHLRVLRDPTQTRNSLAYVLLNRFKHEHAHVDDNPFSSGRYFDGWKKLIGRGAAAKNLELPEYLSTPRSWLAREGWQKASRKYELHS